MSSKLSVRVLSYSIKHVLSSRDSVVVVLHTPETSTLTVNKDYVPEIVLAAKSYGIAVMFIVENESGK